MKGVTLVKGIWEGSAEFEGETYNKEGNKHVTVLDVLLNIERTYDEISSELFGIYSSQQVNSNL